MRDLDILYKAAVPLFAKKIFDTKEVPTPNEVLYFLTVRAGVNLDLSKAFIRRYYSELSADYVVQAWQFTVDTGDDLDSSYFVDVIVPKSERDEYRDRAVKNPSAFLEEIGGSTYQGCSVWSATLLEEIDPLDYALFMWCFTPVTFITGDNDLPW